MSWKAFSITYGSFVLQITLYYQEASIVITCFIVLLQITLYHQEACEAVDEDSLLELCDWGYRKLLTLNSKQHKQTNTKGQHCLQCAACTAPVTICPLP